MGNMRIEQKKINYTLTDPVGSGDDAEDPFYNSLHLVRDWSALNRRGLAQTNSKGSPHVFGVRVTAYGSKIDKGTSNPDESTSDDDVSNSLVTIRFYGAQNTWVYKRAAIKAHNAREKMFKDAGVTKKERGAYSHSIRYALTSSSESYMSPVSTTSRSDIAGGTWDHTQLIFPDDTGGAYLKLTGSHADEESTSAFTDLQLTQLYLASRPTINSDSNVESSTTPADNSVLEKMLTTYRGSNDEVRTLSRGEQDNPPYDLTVAGGDHSDLVELGRIQFNPYTAGGGSCFLEVPFGILYTQTQILDHSDDNADISLDLSVVCEGIATM